jgi:hypothetical protein
VLANANSRSLCAALIFVAVASNTNNARAVTLEVAKQCNASTAKAYPPRVPGNPAAGNANGTARDVQNYYKKCISSGGKMDNNTGTEGK